MHFLMANIDRNKKKNSLIHKKQKLFWRYCWVGETLFDKNYVVEALCSVFHKYLAIISKKLVRKVLEALLEKTCF